MDHTTLASRKIEAEIALVRAQIAKAEHDARPTHPMTRATEIVKVVGALILGVGGVTATFTGYQLTEIRKERMEFDIARKEDELSRKQAELGQVEDALRAKVAEVNQKTSEYHGVTANLTRARVALENARAQLRESGTLASSQTLRSLDEAIEGKNASEKKLEELVEKRKQLFEQMLNIMNSYDQTSERAIQKIN